MQETFVEWMNEFIHSSLCLSQGGFQPWEKKTGCRCGLLILSTTAPWNVVHQTDIYWTSTLCQALFWALGTQLRSKQDKICAFKELAFYRQRHTLNKIKNGGVPGWLSRLSVWLQLRSWSHGSHWALCCQCRARFRFSVPLSLYPSPAHACVLSLSKINKH